MNSINYKMLGAILLPNLGGFLNGRQVTRANLQPWYNKLKFPSFRPPNWLFGPVWISLYTGMGYASYLIYRDGEGFTGIAKMPLLLYGAQLTLNWAWSPIFFGQHNIKGALIEIIALTGTAAACGVTFYKINPLAGYLFIPYVAWLSFATFLNYSIFKLNPQNDAEEKSKKKEIE